jgi:hypothetical protein
MIGARLAGRHPTRVSASSSFCRNRIAARRLWHSGGKSPSRLARLHTLFIFVSEDESLQIHDAA